MKTLIRRRWEIRRRSLELQLRGIKPTG